MDISHYFNNMENTKFLSDSNIIPNIQIPEGCELHFNETTGHWVRRKDLV